MSHHTDSQIVEYHEDGSWTTTTVVTEHPATTKEKAIAGTILGGVLLAPFVPVIAFLAAEKIEERREKRREKKKLKSVED